MPPHPSRDEQLLEAHLALLELDVALLTELTAAGYAVPGRRMPSPAEIRAHVRFAELDRLTEEAAERLAREAAKVRDAVLDGIAENLADLYSADDPTEVTRRLNALLDPMSEVTLGDDVRNAVTTATDNAYATLAELHQAGGDEAIGEARRQGAAGTRNPAPLDERTAGAIRAQSERVATQPVARLLTVARDAAALTPTDATPADALQAALDAAEQASTKADEDNARQAVTVAHDAGRTATVTDLAGSIPPKEVYASELLDSATCSPCSFVDGRDYDTLEDGLADYPGNGGYHACSGGSRCRGTLVIVWDTEAAPSIDDRRPEDPEAPPRQPRTPPPDDTPPAGLDLNNLGDAPLAALQAEFDTAMAAGQYAEAEALSDELDRRQGPVTIDVDDSPASDVNAWGQQVTHFDTSLTRAGVNAPGARPAARGRRRDEVRAEFDSWAYEQSLKAEEETRGNLLRRDRKDEYIAKYGTSPMALFTGPVRSAGYYASEELRLYWQTNTRLTFAEFSIDSGITDAKTVARARAAKEARDDVLSKNDASTSGKRRRPPAKTRRPLTEGDKLKREQDRAARARALEAKAARRANPPDAGT